VWTAVESGTKIRFSPLRGRSTYGMARGLGRMPGAKDISTTASTAGVDLTVDISDVLCSGSTMGVPNALNSCFMNGCLCVVCIGIRLTGCMES